MSTNKITVNKYGDIIIYTEDGAVDLTPYTLKDSVTIKSKVNVDYDGFEIISHIDNLHIYANEACRNKCPPIFNNEICGSASVCIVNNKYVIGVKDRTQKYITNSCGYREAGDADYEACALRELNEETSILADEVTAIQLCGYWNYVNNCYDHIWIGKTQLFVLNVTLSETRLLDVRNYSDDEIEKVFVIPIENLLDKLDVNWSDHHLLAVKFVLAKLDGKDYDWVSEKPTYLKAYELVWN